MGFKDFLVSLDSAQQFGEQMQHSNPELFDQLRGQAQAAVDDHRSQNESQEEQDPQPGQDIFYVLRDCSQLICKYPSLISD